MTTGELVNSSGLGRQMEAEMRQQPEILAALADRLPALADQVADLFPAGRPAGVAFVARGSSDHAALLGRYAVELHSGLPTSQVAPSLATAYRRDPAAAPGWLLVALSQSGHTPEIVHLARSHSRAGAKVLAITNDPQSPLAHAADLTIDLAAGPEHAIPATKTVTSQMLAVLAITGALTAPQARQIAAHVADLLDDTRGLDDAARLITSHPGLVVTGRGACYPAALETALKLQETIGVLAHGFSTADLRHGTTGMTGPGVPALLLAGSGPADPDTLDLRQTLHARDAEHVLIGTAPDAHITIPALCHLGECILATVRGQQLALAAARAAGIDPDHPTGLNKVTLTA